MRCDAVVFSSAAEAEGMLRCAGVAAAGVEPVDGARRGGGGGARAGNG